MKNGASVIVDRTHDFVRSIEKLVGQRVLVGYPASTSARDGPITNAALGYIHEHGAPEANIPARPHLVPGVNNAKARLIAKFRQIGEAALAGQAGKADMGFAQAGLIAQNAVKAKISEGVPPPLAESTLAARRRRGRTGSVPLVDTGALRNAVAYVVRKVAK